MKRLCSFILLSCLVILAGCNAHDDEDVAAIVRGEEITVGDLRFLFEEDKIIDNLDGTIKAKLAEQEVKKMNLDLSEDLQEIQATKSTFSQFFQSSENETETAKENRKIIDTKAKKLGLSTEEYLEKQYVTISETNLYMLKYVAQIIGEPLVDDEDFDIEAYNTKGNQVLDKLVKDNENEIEKFLN